MSFVKRIMGVAALGAALLLGLPSVQAAYIVTSHRPDPTWSPAAAAPSISTG